MIQTTDSFVVCPLSGNVSAQIMLYSFTSARNALQMPFTVIFIENNCRLYPGDLPFPDLNHPNKSRFHFDTYTDRYLCCWHAWIWVLVLAKNNTQKILHKFAFLIYIYGWLVSDWFYCVNTWSTLLYFVHLEFVNDLKRSWPVFWLKFEKNQKKSKKIKKNPKCVPNLILSDTPFAIHSYSVFTYILSLVINFCTTFNSHP